MGDNKNCVDSKFFLIMIAITGIWTFILRDTFHGYFGFRLILLYSSFKVFNAIIHNIHYKGVKLLYNPFVLLLIFGLYYYLDKTQIAPIQRYIIKDRGEDINFTSVGYVRDIWCHVKLIWGFDYLGWFFKDHFYYDLYDEIPYVKLRNLPTFLLSFTPYIALISNIMNDKKDD